MIWLTSQVYRDTKGRHCKFIVTQKIEGDKRQEGEDAKGKTIQKEQYNKDVSSFCVIDFIKF